MDVHGLCTVYARSVYGLCTVCALSVYGLCTVCVRSVYDLCTVCARSVRDLCAVCARSVHGLCTVCAWMCMVCWWERIDLKHDPFLSWYCTISNSCQPLVSARLLLEVLRRQLWIYYKAFVSQGINELIDQYCLHTAYGSDVTTGRQGIRSKWVCDNKKPCGLCDMDCSVLESGAGGTSLPHLPLPPHHFQYIAPR